jgi:hypothetical protein
MVIMNVQTHWVYIHYLYTEDQIVMFREMLQKPEI